MNAEALIGTMLGTCMLQRLIGQGGMGAVFLAQQSRPKRQVAVKVLLTASSQSPQQEAAFLERFRRETDAAASLEHPNIVPVHEYGERDGLAYLVMPYIGGGTLRDEMEQVGKFSLAKIVSYLDQLAGALDFAHERGVIHRDIKPANILMTQERRLLLTDFGLVKVVAGIQGTTANTRLTAAGVPLGTPDYMSPEQVIGGEIDARADLYSLGVILYQMVTGTTPFKGEMPMQVAMQHLHTPLPAPRSYRQDLPPAAEQVILRALAKNPSDRYSKVGDFSNAFRLALTVAGVPLGDTQLNMPIPRVSSNGQSFAKRSLFDPMWQGASQAQVGGLQEMSLPGMGPGQTSARNGEASHRNDIVAKTSMTMPSLSGFLEASTSIMPQVSPAARPEQVTPLPETVLPQEPVAVEQGQAAAPFAKNAFVNSGPPSMPGLRLGRKSVLRPVQGVNAEQSASFQNTVEQNNGIPPAMFSASQHEEPDVPQLDFQTFEAPQTARPTTLAGFGGQMGMKNGNGLFAPPAQAMQAAPEQSQHIQNHNVEGEKPSTALQPFPAVTRNLHQTGALVPGAYDGQTGAVKLTQAMKLVKVPVAGKPGTYMTGLLPMLPDAELPPTGIEGMAQKHSKKLALVALVLLVVLGSSGLFWLFSARNPGAATQSAVKNNATVDTRAQATVSAKATAQAANIIIEDSLSTNIHFWKEDPKGDRAFFFKDGKYHVAINNGSVAALADLPEQVMPDSFVFSVDAAEMKGDDTSPNNQFGLVFRLNQTQKNGKSLVTFYCFQVQSTKDNLQYQMRKYDSSFEDDAEKWSTPWSAKVGKEYHTGQGAKATNTFKVEVKGSRFTFIMNGKTVGKFEDKAFKAGRVGFLVNEKGTEVAFSNLLLTYR